MSDPATSATTKLPPWSKPSPENVSHAMGLKVSNSLTREKDDFVTMDGTPQIRWYMCGPTVYAPSHMGHARAYLSFDILRRILQDYFGFDVLLIMNVTDLDDKIIERAAEQGIPHYELSRKFEAEFHQDMKDLGVQPPTVLTRVTEYMTEIVEYIQTLVEKKLAYESNGSVYFHVEEFENAEGFHYCKLAPEQIHNAQLLMEGEGKLSQTHGDEKKSPRDFALWKASKPNEPQWESPWGPGRPGWHIECSVMASHVLRSLADGTDKMDLHTGGVDLKFPHHDNEMAQAEAYSGCSQWVNYFLHAGHLHIHGFKMSKSLKNFITIQQALETHSARQIRLCFLLHKYNAPMDYGDNTMSHAIVSEKLFTEFFHNVKAALRETSLDARQTWTKGTKELQKTLQQTRIKVDVALKDDFDTPAVITALEGLIKATNVYLKESEGDAVVGLVLRNVAEYVTRILKVFGLIGDSDIGFPSEDGGSSREEVLSPVVSALMHFRTRVRDNARQKDTGGVLKECDDFRDDILPELGIRLEDKGDKSVFKLVDPQELMREKEQKQAEAQRKLEEKKKKAEEAAKKEALNKLPPAEFVKQLTLDDGRPKYTKFDEKGLPTHNADGEALNKNQSKKAAKEFQAQQKKYDKYMSDKK